MRANIGSTDAAIVGFFVIRSSRIKRGGENGDAGPAEDDQTEDQQSGDDALLASGTKPIERPQPTTSFRLYGRAVFVTGLRTSCASAALSTIALGHCRRCNAFSPDGRLRVVVTAFIIWYSRPAQQALGDGPSSRSRCWCQQILSRGLTVAREEDCRSSALRLSSFIYGKQSFFIPGGNGGDLLESR